MPEDKEFLQKLKAAFAEEGREHVSRMSAGLLALEKAVAEDERAAIIERVFREAHNLKGSAQAVSMSQVSNICQCLESIFAVLKRKELSITEQLLTDLHCGVDTVGMLLDPSLQPSESTGQTVASVIALLKQAMSGNIRDDARPAASTLPEQAMLGVVDKVQTAEPVKISGHKLDSLLLKAEEMLALKNVLSEQSHALNDMHSFIGPWEKEWSRAYADVKEARKLLSTLAQSNQHPNLVSACRKLFEFMDWNHAQVSHLNNRLAAFSRQAVQNERLAANTIDSFLEDTKQLMLMPCSTLFEIFPKAVRELARELGKEVELLISGDSIEVDKRILSDMKDPLLHLVRNSIDHGIEAPEQRKNCGKPPKAVMRISVTAVEGSLVQITVADDGSGISLDKVRAQAVKQGYVTAEQADKLTKDEIISFIFHSSFSTSEMLTDISGRGLGMSIVRDTVHRLGGRLLVETEDKAGTSFKITLPITLATFRGVLVDTASNPVLIPTANIDRVVRVAKEEIKSVENSATIVVSDVVLPIVPLYQVLEFSLPEEEEHQYVTAVVVSAAESKVAFSVESILEEQEVLVKPLPQPFSKIKNVAGVSLLGTGKAVPVLNPLDLVRSAEGISTGSTRRMRTAVKEKVRQTILVVDDTITARMLLKNILESAGYLVQTATDGVEALTCLRQSHFDLVVTDVEMPNMNGFDLVQSIRKDSALSDLPVVLVTSLASRSDRERGVEVGANAYFVKSSFDQDNLLEVVMKLL